MKLDKTRSFLTAAACGAVAMTANLAAAQTRPTAATVLSAVDSDSPSAIISELERAESLVCPRCIEPVRALLDDPRHEVRVVAAWWFARRPQRRALSDRSISRVGGNDSTLVRDAADVLGAFRHAGAVSALASALARTALTVEARVHVARALGKIGHPNGSAALAAAMQDSNAELRLEAVSAWLDIRAQPDAAPVVNLIGDADPAVRRKAAAVIGSLRDAAGRTLLEGRLGNDDDPAVRRNAAWALGRIGDLASADALQAATEDPSSLVRMTARVALRRLR